MELWLGLGLQNQFQTFAQPLSPTHNVDLSLSTPCERKGNADSCYWGLPSIQASDPAYPPLGYWRGYVWGPMIQLVHALVTPIEVI